MSPEFIELGRDPVLQVGAVRVLRGGRQEIFLQKCFSIVQDYFLQLPRVFRIGGYIFKKYF